MCPRRFICSLSPVNRCEDDRLRVSCQLHLLYIRACHFAIFGVVVGTPNYCGRNPPTIVVGTPLENPSSPHGFCFSGLPRAVLEQLRAYKAVRLTCVKRVIFLWLTPYAFKTLRSDGEQLNGNQVLESLVAVTHCEFSSGVKHWRSCSATACLAERLRHILTHFVRSGIPRRIFYGSF